MILRVFPRRTSHTPTDKYAVIGRPDLFDISPRRRKDIEEIHVSCTFTWDIEWCEELVRSWERWFPGIPVKLGGPAIAEPIGDFTPGLYVKKGIVYTSRGCPKYCGWCLVHKREGCIRELPIKPGYIIQDNNFLACSRAHRAKVYEMLKAQRSGAKFAGGLDTEFLEQWDVDQWMGMRINELWFACDFPEALKMLELTAGMLKDFPRRKKRCYVLIGYKDETISAAEERLEAVWDLGFMPFAQYYKPPEGHRTFAGRDWLLLVRKWSRPAAMFAAHPKQGSKERWSDWKEEVQIQTKELEINIWSREKEKS